MRDEGNEAGEYKIGIYGRDSNDRGDNVQLRQISVRRT